MVWGSFHIVEGVVDHVLLGIHHVRDDLGGPASWASASRPWALLVVDVGSALHNTGAATTWTRTASCTAASRSARRARWEVGSGGPWPSVTTGS